MSPAKYLLSSVVIGSAIVGYAAATRNDARNHADQIIAMRDSVSTTTADSTTPNPDSLGGGYLRATINGRSWEATEMTPDMGRGSSLVVNGRNSSGFLNFNIDGTNTEVDKPRLFRKTSAVMYWDENNETWFGTKGEAVVTKVDAQWIEGKFHFAAEKNGQKVVGENGEFRVPSRPGVLSSSNGS